MVECPEHAQLLGDSKPNTPRLAVTFGLAVLTTAIRASISLENSQVFRNASNSMVQDMTTFGRRAYLWTSCVTTLRNWNNLQRLRPINPCSVRQHGSSASNLEDTGHMQFPRRPSLNPKSHNGQLFTTCRIRAFPFFFVLISPDDDHRPFPQDANSLYTITNHCSSGINQGVPGLGLLLLEAWCPSLPFAMDYTCTSDHITFSAQHRCSLFLQLVFGANCVLFFSPITAPLGFPFPSSLSRLHMTLEALVKVVG